MERKIVAIGGGEMGRPGTKKETVPIDKEIIALSGKKKPKVLFIPTASKDSEGYVQVFFKYYGKLGADVSVLSILKENLSRKEIKEKIMGSDIVYVGGGNTMQMMKKWRAAGVDVLLRKAARKGIVLCGLSAGSVCWFREGNSDSLKSMNPKLPYVKVRGLNLIPALHCPHYDAEFDRQASVKKMMKTTPGVAIALDNCCAIEIVGKTYRIIRSKKTAKARKLYWKGGKYHDEPIESSDSFEPLAHLLAKKDTAV